MEQKILPKECLPFIISCSLILLGFLFLAIYPFHKSLASLDSELIGIKSQIGKQGIISPFFKELLIKINNKNNYLLPFPQKSDLEREKAQKVPSIFQGMAFKSNLLLVKVDPDIRLLTRKGSDLLSTGILLKGDLLNFRRFLINLGSIPYLESIEEIQIESIEGSYLLRLKINLNIKKG